MIKRVLSIQRYRKCTKSRNKYFFIYKFLFSQITDTHFLSEEKILTVGYDGFIKVVDIKEKNVLKSFKVCDFCLSASKKLNDQDIFAVK